ncbi:germination protein GerAC [Moorella thermoacetica]|uniref:Spore germination B3 GerAC like protein n=1 Tax=Moorella thermoacetica (strain ATCC 39073 / JCM 9320) TaxID=264732 RepID=Q2RIG7_MOOTA|nr:Ger(x)C family spore germination protein [Moorella thermoacetica]AKX96883.1 spore germination protein B3 precursor [Moorella thermoacetica]OIQ58053.1 spore germination protein B3 precursor [Moorella thermoacetica]QDA00712.1 Spore germination protein B3 precursor [Moorella thermoacetica]TYL11607.1 hypothetical protein MOOCA_04780 [Moorella thermoacetica]TYL12468.1 hypothetical protein MOLA_04780 [Moorella thermoacetica]
MPKLKRLVLFTSILGAFALAFSAGGCWDRREINELAFLSCAAFDLEGGNRVLTSEFIRPSAAGGGERGGGETLPQRQALIVSNRNKTFLAIGREKALGLPRRAYLAHTAAVLVGEEMARYGIKEVLDFVDRNPEIRRTTLILLTRGPAREVLVRAQSGLEKTLGREITGLHKWVQVSGYGYIPNINDIFFDLSGDAGTTVLPVLELSPQPFPPILGPATATGGGIPAGRAGEPETLMTARLNGAGLFYHDKLVAWLDQEQTRGWAWVRNKVKSAMLALPRQENSLVSVNIISSRAEAAIDMQGGRPQGKIKIKVEGDLLEEQCYQDFTKEEAVKSLESRMAAQITSEISSALNQAKMAGTDVFGFGGALHRRYPEVWRQLEGRWNEEFKKLPVTISVEAKLRRTGMTGRPWQPGAR